MIELVHLGEFPSIGAVWLRYPQGGREGDYVTIGGVKHVWNKYRMRWGDASDLIKDARGKTIIEGDLDVYHDLSVGGTLRSKFGVQGGDVGAWVDEVKQALADIRASRGRAGGVAPLDEYGTVPSKHLPSQAKFEQDLRRDLADSVSPMTLRVMRILQGDPSLQFVFIQSMVSAVRVDHIVNYDKANRILKVPEGVIQHLTLGIDTVRPNRPLKDYRRWSVPALSWMVGGDEVRTLYLYAKVSKEGSAGEFVVTDKAVGLEGEAGYYMLLVGMLSAPPDRVFSKLYGFSEYLPGLIRIERLESPDGEFVIDLVRKTIQGGEVTFKSGGAMDDRLNEIINEARGYTDRKRDELKSYTDSKSEGGRRYADSKADAVRRDAERRAQEVSDESRGYTDGKLKEGKDYTDRVLTEAKEELKKGFVDTGEMNRRFAELQKQIDKEVSNWYYPGAPERGKDPEKNWETKEERDKHVGDTYTSTDDPPSPHAGKSWRYTNDHTWKSIVDSDSLKALKIASEAKAAADGKTTTYFEKPSKYKRGDSWVLTQAEEVGGKSYPRGVTLYALEDSEVYNSSHWVRLDEYISSVEAKEYADGKASDALEKSKGYSDEADKKVRKRIDEQSSATLKGAKEYADGKDEAVRKDAQTGADKAKEDAIAEAEKKDRAVIDQSNRAIDKAKEDLRTYTNDKVKEVSDGMATYDYLRRSILEGDTKVYGGLVLSNVLATRDVARGGIRSFMAGTKNLPAFASGVSDFGTPEYKAVVELLHDGMGHIGNMYIEQGGAVVSFRPKSPSEPTVRIGGSQSSLSDMLNSASQETNKRVDGAGGSRMIWNTDPGVREMLLASVSVDVLNDGSTFSINLPWSITARATTTGKNIMNPTVEVRVRLARDGGDDVMDERAYMTFSEQNMPESNPNIGGGGIGGGGGNNQLNPGDGGIGELKSLDQDRYGSYEGEMHGSLEGFSKIILGVKKGRYTLYVTIDCDITHISMDNNGIRSKLIVEYQSFVGAMKVSGVNDLVREVVFGSRGMSMFFGKNKVIHADATVGPNGKFFQVIGNVNIPGILYAGEYYPDEYSFGTTTSNFGSLSEGALYVQRLGEGVYQVTHNLGHLGYTVQLTPLWRSGYNPSNDVMARMEGKEANTFNVVTGIGSSKTNEVPFSFMIIGPNYKP